MPGPYRRLDVPNVNQHVVTAPPAKVKKAAAQPATEPVESGTVNVAAPVKTTVAKSTAKKSTAKKSTAKKSTAKKSTAKKA